MPALVGGLVQGIELGEGIVAGGLRGSRFFAENEAAGFGPNLQYLPGLATVAEFQVQPLDGLFVRKLLQVDPPK